MARNGKKLSTGNKKKLLDFIALLTEQYADVAAVWGRLTAAQRAAYLEHSPVLAAVLAFARQFEEVR